MTIVTRIEFYTAFPGLVMEFNKVDTGYVNYTDFYIDIPSVLQRPQVTQSLFYLNHL